MLEKQGVYQFATGDLLESILDDVRAMEAGEFGDGLRGNPLATTGLTTPEITEAVRRALSPEDLQRIAAPEVLRAGQYVSAERDSVIVQIRVEEHIEGVVDELQLLMRESEAYERLLEHEVEPTIREAVAEGLDGKEAVSGWMLYLLGSPESAEDNLVRVVLSVVTAEWLAGQVEQASGPFMDYLVGDSYGFKITARLTGAPSAAAYEETKAVLREVDAHDLVHTGVIESVVFDSLEAEVRLPYGLVVTREEVASALRQSDPPGLVQQEAEMLVDGVSAYLTGRSPEFSTEVSLERRSGEVVNVLTGMMTAKLSESLTVLPACITEEQKWDALDTFIRQAMPDCFPQGVISDVMVDQASGTLTGPVRTLALGPLPSTITFTEADLRAALREEGGLAAVETLDSFRAVFLRGWYYDHKHLRADLQGKGNALEVLEETRAFLADGYELTARDRPRSRVGLAVGKVRGWFETVRRYGWVVYGAASILLVIIGFLGGTTWRGRIAWATVVLLLSATVVFTLLVPHVYDGLIGGALTQANVNMIGPFEGPFSSTSILVTDKLFSMTRAVADEFAKGIMLSSLVLVAVSFGVLLGTIFWGRFFSLAGSSSSNATAGPPGMPCLSSACPVSENLDPKPKPR